MQRDLLRRVLRRVLLETAFEKVVRRVRRRCAVSSQIWLFAIFTRKLPFALFCALLRSFALVCGLTFALFCVNLRSFALICALLRAFARFCIRPRLERPRLGNANSKTGPSRRHLEGWNMRFGERYPFRALRWHIFGVRSVELECWEIRAWATRVRHRMRNIGTRLELLSQLARTLSDPTKMPHHETGVAKSLSHCVSCGVRPSLLHPH